jgi:hypothetical protein
MVNEDTYSSTFAKKKDACRLVCGDDIDRPRRASSKLPHASAGMLSIRQHTSAYVSIRQHTSAYVSIRQHTSAYVSIRQHTSAYVSIRQHTSAYVSGCGGIYVLRKLPHTSARMPKHTYTVAC